jgi:hypothetical protein
MDDFDDDICAVAESGVMRLRQQTGFKRLRLKGTEGLFQGASEFRT